MNQPAQIRFARKKDLERIIELCELHATFEKSAYDDKGKVAQLEKHLFSDPPALYCLVAERDDRLVGYATYMKQFSTWDADFYIYMDCLYLTEESRGFGIGEKLMDRIKAEGKKLGCSLIQWQTPAFNKRAIKFYDRMGGSSKSKERYFLDI
jgi:GNAT superfamily N-acetyltransferase